MGNQAAPVASGSIDGHARAELEKQRQKRVGGMFTFLKREPERPGDRRRLEAASESNGPCPEMTGTIRQVD